MPETFKTAVQLDEAGRPTDTCIYMVHDGTSLKKITHADLVNGLIADGAGPHNGIYRGKNLGTSVTTEQYAEITSGRFRDLYIGDYWVINGRTWIIAAFDYYYQMGDPSCNTHHAVIIPSNALYNGVMNDTHTTEGGYVGSKMYTEGLEEAKEIVNAAFGSDHILSHRAYLCNAVSGGKPSGRIWCDSTVELMTENQVYGGPAMQQMAAGGSTVNNYRIEKSQLPYFRFATHTKIYYWLQDVVSASAFANVNNNGRSDYYLAGNSIGVRPHFCIS